MTVKNVLIVYPERGRSTRYVGSSQKPTTAMPRRGVGLNGCRNQSNRKSNPKEACINITIITRLNG